MPDNEHQIYSDTEMSYNGRHGHPKIKTHTKTTKEKTFSFNESLNLVQM
jgi:hypothetical protein